MLDPGAPSPSSPSSAARLVPIAAVAGATLAACGLLAALFDEPATRWAGSSVAGTTVGEFAGGLTHVGESTWIFIAAAAAVVAGLLLRMPRLAGSGVLFAVATAFSGILVNLLKVLFGRARPKLLEEEGAFAFSPFSIGYDWASFPSGHSTTALTLAGVMWVLWPRLRWGWLLAGVAVASTRWAIGAHYPADVLAGSVLGFGCGFFLARTAPRWWPRNWRRCASPVPVPARPAESLGENSPEVSPSWSSGSGSARDSTTG